MQQAELFAFALIINRAALAQRANSVGLEIEPIRRGGGRDLDGTESLWIAKLDAPTRISAGCCLVFRSSRHFRCVCCRSS